MMPIKVDSINDGVKIGVDNFRHNQKRFDDGLAGLADAIPDSILTARIQSEESDNLKAQRLEAEIANAEATGDIAKLKELIEEKSLFQKGKDLFNSLIPDSIGQKKNELPDLDIPDSIIKQRIDEKNYLGSTSKVANPEEDANGELEDVDIKAGFPPLDDYIPDFMNPNYQPEMTAEEKKLVNQVNNSALLDRAKEKANKLRGDTTVMRAAERAGKDTGYLKMSEQDKLAHDEYKDKMKYDHEMELQGVQDANKAALAKQAELAKKFEKGGHGLAELASTTNWNANDKNRFMTIMGDITGTSADNKLNLLNGVIDVSKGFPTELEKALRDDINNAINSASDAATKGNLQGVLNTVLNGQTVASAFKVFAGIPDEALKQKLITSVMKSNALIDEGLAKQYISTYLTPESLSEYKALKGIGDVTRELPPPPPPQKKTGGKKTATQNNDSEF